MSGTTTTADPPLLVDAAAAARLCGMSRSSWFTLQASGEIPKPVLRRARLVRWSRDSIIRWIERGCPRPEGRR